MIGWIISIFFGACACFVIWAITFIIDEGHVVVIERFGRFHRIAKPGKNHRIPFVERMKSIEWAVTKERIVQHKDDEGRPLPGPPQKVAYIDTVRTDRIPTYEITIDPPSVYVNFGAEQLKAQVNVIFTLKIFEVQKAVYVTNQLYTVVDQKISSALLHECGAMSDISPKKARAEISQILKRRVMIRANDDLKPYGVELVNVDLQSLELDDKLTKANSEQIAKMVELDTLKHQAAIELEIDQKRAAARVEKWKSYCAQGADQAKILMEADNWQRLLESTVKTIVIPNKFTSIGSP